MSTEIENQILDNLTTAVLALDRRLRPMAINPAAEALLQLSANKLLGQPLFEC
ncbi:MAG: PAS domain-containing protein, partial [Acidiferrobacterales bacterium]